jgi:glycosyltransferase involved in cell wall biosynthesis
MRAALVIYGDLATPSGGFLYDRMLVDTFRRAGDAVDVFSLPWKTYGGCLRQNFDRGLRSALLGWDGDLLLEDELTHPSLLLLNRWLHRARRVPVISIVHHLRCSELHPRIAHEAYRRVERSYLRSVDGFLFNSRATRRTVEELIRGPVDGIVVTPGGDRLGPGLSEEEILRRCESVGPLRVLFVGNIILRKGLHVLVEALGTIPEAQWRLTIVGARGMDPSYAASVDRVLASRGLLGKVHMPGPLDDAFLAAALREHHVLVVPSQYEGFGIVYLEAMGFGVVPIGSQAGGAAEIIEHERSGLLVPAGDARALAAAIADLAGNRGRLRILALEALRRFRAFPGWQESMGAAHRHLQKLVLQRGA